MFTCMLTARVFMKDLEEAMCSSSCLEGSNAKERPHREGRGAWRGFGSGSPSAQPGGVVPAQAAGIESSYMLRDREAPGQQLVL